MGHESKVQSNSLLTNAESSEAEITLKKIIEDLRWKLDYEKKIGKEMMELLEKKVSMLMAQINTMHEEAAESKQKIDKSEEEIEKNQQKIIG